MHGVELAVGRSVINFNDRSETIGRGWDKICYQLGLNKRDGIFHFAHNNEHPSGVIKIVAQGECNESMRRFKYSIHAKR